MKVLITFRHGDRFKNTGELSGDGPLTPKGIEEVTVSANALAEQLQHWGYEKIDLAVVSGSIRCAQTFAIIWHVFLKFGIIVSEYDMRKEFFSTPDEDKGWADLYEKHRDELFSDINEIGEMSAVLKHATRLVKPCANRTIARIQTASEDGKEIVLSVTHAPHDYLIESHFGLMGRTECLELGKYSISRYE